MYACLCPPTHVQKWSGLWSSCDWGMQGPCSLQTRALHQQRGAEPSPGPSNRVLKCCLATCACQRPPQPMETAKGDEFSKWDLLFKYFLQCTDSWKRGQQGEWKQRNCGGGMRNKRRVMRIQGKRQGEENKIGEGKLQDVRGGVIREISRYWEIEQLEEECLHLQDECLGIKS